MRSVFAAAVADAVADVGESVGKRTESGSVTLILGGRDLHEN